MWLAEDGGVDKGGGKVQTYSCMVVKYEGLKYYMMTTVNFHICLITVLTVNPKSSHHKGGNKGGVFL